MKYFVNINTHKMFDYKENHEKLSRFNILVKNDGDTFY